MASDAKSSGSGNWETIAFIALIVATVVFVAVVYANFYGIFIKDIGPTLCSDGWRSGSLGIQGACSHHGGIDYGPLNAVRRKSFWLAILVGAVFFSIWLLIFYLVSSIAEKLQKPVANEEFAEGEKKNLEDKNIDDHTCPRCGGEMIPKNKKIGDAQLQFPSMRMWLECSKCHYREDILLE